MIETELEWHNLGSVKALCDILKPDDYYRKLSVEPLKKIGFYMFIDETGQARYIGQAFNTKVYPLAHRVRWEITKDGNGCTTSAFFEQCNKETNRLDRFKFNLKVAHIHNPTDNGISLKESDITKKFMNAVERALIFRMYTLGHSLINEAGISSYNLGPIKITNTGDFEPIPKEIEL
jgi:hypothetical protein